MDKPGQLGGEIIEPVDNVVLVDGRNFFERINEETVIEPVHCPVAEPEPVQLFTGV